MLNDFALKTHEFALCLIISSRYHAAVQMAGGVCKFVPIELQNDKWEVDMGKLEAAISPKTKLMLINTPHNPTGKVFTRAELECVADILRRHPHVIAVTDEVYEKLVFDGREHVRLASMPDMWERTITISSSGKTFSCTGWKVGWVYGAAHLVRAVTLANQWIVFCICTPAQRAIATILKEADEPYMGFPDYYAYVRSHYEKKRDDLAESLKLANIKPIVPEGGFFIMADTSKYEVPDKYVQQPGPTGESPVTRDWAFARCVCLSVLFVVVLYTGVVAVR